MVDARDKQTPSFNQDHVEERSVEDILASIRQMIATEIDASKEKVDSSNTPVKLEESDSIELDSSVGASAIDVLDLTTEIDENGNIISNSGVNKTSFSEKKELSQNDQNISLLSEANESNAVDAFASLASEVRVTANEHCDNVNNDRTANPTLEDIVKTILKPMLREWLDKNLDQMVKRLIQREIERISEKSSKK